MVEEVIILQPVPRSGQKWLPVVGEFTQSYVDKLSNFDTSSKQRLLDESAGILGNCLPPETNSYSEAGLVVGYVQSGKTQSFTTVTALARDNGYGLVIVLAGITHLLTDQSVERLIDDLQMDDDEAWVHLGSPGAKDITFEHADRVYVDQKLKAWLRFQQGKAGSRPSLLITVLKNKPQIEKLAALLSTIDLAEIPTLLIDDESDQASPNLKSSTNLKRQAEDESSTFSAIKKLRSTLPKHSYLQYTATPQANLLAAKSDILSPSFARVLSAGGDYTGGEFFFGGVTQPNIRILDAADTINPRSLPDEPPESLLTALKFFWVGAAVVEIERGSSRTKINRSMMIQVSQQTNAQAVFRNWVSKIRQEWHKILEDENHALHFDLQEEFREVYEDLAYTYSQIPPMEQVKEKLFDALDRTNVVEVNSTEEAVKQIKWKDERYWILIGGMKLDRGFTVRGITTTYMPRTPAENADTLQQRARFFGYHRPYAGLCRIFISDVTFDAFKKYLEHESSVRESLLKHEGKPLKDWKRQFILDRSLNPTRRSVIGLLTRRTLIEEGWISPRFMHENAQAIVNNGALFETFITELKRLGAPTQNPYVWRDTREGPHHALFEGVRMSSIREFLTRISLSNSNDSSKLLALCIGLQRFENEHADENPLVDVVLIRGYTTFGLQGAEASPEKGISNIFIGRNPKSAKEFEDLAYVGDNQIRTSRTTLHLRLILEKQTVDDNGVMVPIPWFAIHPAEGVTSSILEEVE